MHQLELWFRALKLALDTEFAQGTEWDPRVAALIRPTPLESFEDWSHRCGQYFAELHEYPVIEHKSVDEFEEHWMPGTNEIHVTLDLHYSKQKLLAAVADLIDRCHATKPGLPSRLTVGEFQLNVPATPRTLTHISRAIKVCELAWEGTLSQLGIAKKVGIKYAESDANEAEAIRQVLRLRAFGKDAVRGIRLGRFPDPALLPDGQADPSYQPKRPNRGE